MTSLQIATHSSQSANGERRTDSCRYYSSKNLTGFFLPRANINVKNIQYIKGFVAIWNIIIWFPLDHFYASKYNLDTMNEIDSWYTELWFSKIRITLKH